MHIDHISVYVKNYEDAKKFYTAVFEAIGGKIIMDIPEYKSCGYGDKDPFFWISEKEITWGQHIAISVSNEEEVQKFYEAALLQGATDNGVPGPREAYGPNYYAAFVITPEWNNLEAVYHKSI